MEQKCLIIRSDVRHVWEKYKSPKYEDTQDFKDGWSVSKFRKKPMEQEQSKINQPKVYDNSKWCYKWMGKMPKLWIGGHKKI